MRFGRFGVSFVMFGMAAAMGCGGSSKGASNPAPMGGSDKDALYVPKVDPQLCDATKHTVATSDLNKDGKPDVWKLYEVMEEDGTKIHVLTCKQVDFDHDGRKDYVATYLRTGEITAEEFDFSFDGSFDAREHYDKKTGKRVLVERDSDHDKKADMWERYTSEGALDAIQRDRNGDGKPDVWEQYRNGELLAILYDDDYDNRVDRKDTSMVAPPPVPTNEPAKPEAGPADENVVEPVPAAAPDAAQADEAAKKPAAKKKSK